jgi:hypothetical protein
VIYGAGHNTKRLVLQCIDGVSSNPVEGRTKNCQLKDLILTLLGLIFRCIFIYIYIYMTAHFPEHFKHTRAHLVPRTLNAIATYINPIVICRYIQIYSN